MAKVLSHVWSTISGSVGGITYFNGPHAAIIARSRVNPVQPSTLFQSQVKSAWNGANGVWEGLTSTEQALWDDYALTVTHQGKQGNYTVTGRSMFMAGRSLQNYILLRLFTTPTFVVTAPATNGFLLPSGFNVQAPGSTGTGIGISVTADLVDDTYVYISVSGAFDKERHFWKGPWASRDAVAQIVPAGTSVVINILGLSVGKFYFVRVKCVADDASPRVSEEWYGRGEAQVTI